MIQLQRHISHNGWSGAFVGLTCDGCGGVSGQCERTGILTGQILAAVTMARYRAAIVEGWTRNPLPGKWGGQILYEDLCAACAELERHTWAPSAEL